MRQHIDTAPIWEVYKQDCECPLCLLQAKVESANVNYFLGESVMEPDQRIEVNQKGFCPRHFKQLYDAGNRLGLGLMTHTYMKETIRSLKNHADQIKQAAAEEAGKPIFKRIGPKKGACVAESAAKIADFSQKCVLSSVCSSRATRKACSTCSRSHSQTICRAFPRVSASNSDRSPQISFTSVSEQY